MQLSLGSKKAQIQGVLHGVPGSPDRPVALCPLVQFSEPAISDSDIKP